MKVRLLECVLIDAKPTPPDTVVEVTETEAASLIRRKMAVQAEDGPAPVEGTFLDATAAPEPKPKRGKRK